MIDGLKLTFSGEELRTLLDVRIQEHVQRVERWRREQTRDPQDATEDEPVLPLHMCENEASRHHWRSLVLAFIRDHVETGETYRLNATDLEFGELLPNKPSCLEQEEYEERTAVGFNLERLTKDVSRLATSASELAYSSRLPERDDDLPPPAGTKETEEFITTRLDILGGPISSRFSGNEWPGQTKTDSATLSAQSGVGRFLGPSCSTASPTRKATR